MSTYASIACLLFLGLAGCDPQDTCTQGETCVCAGVGNCEITCAEEGGCAFETKGIGNAFFTCVGGGCSVDANGQGNVELDCAGGDCAVTNEGAGTVTVACEGGGCEVDCNGIGSCEINDCPTCVCNGGLLSTCSVD